MKKGTKCNKCKTADAVVYFSIVKGKGSVSRSKYCSSCALHEKIRVTTHFLNQSEKSTMSPMDLVQQEMEKSYVKPAEDQLPSNLKTIPSQIKKLEKELSEAVLKEDYEKAAYIRDKISVIKNSNG